MSNTKEVEESDKVVKPVTIPVQVPPSKSAEWALNGMLSSAILTQAYAKTFIGDLDVPALWGCLIEKAERVHNGDLCEIETLLCSQASALDIIFVKLCLLAKANMEEHFDAADRLMRLALKAQGQCRATLETLAAIKNPPVVIAGQANIAHGPQQVNNNAVVSANKTIKGPDRARGENSNFVQNELLEHKNEQWLDIGAPAKASSGDREMATMDLVHRPSHHYR